MHVQCPEDLLGFIPTAACLGHKVNSAWPCFETPGRGGASCAARDPLAGPGAADARQKRCAAATARRTAATASCNRRHAAISQWDAGFTCVGGDIKRCAHRCHRRSQ